MKVLWNSDVPLSARDICKINPDISQNTVQSLLKKLLKYNFVKIQGFKSSGTISTRVYLPLISESDYFFSLTSKNTLKKFFSAFISSLNNKEELELFDKKIQEKIKDIK